MSDRWKRLSPRLARAPVSLGRGDLLAFGVVVAAVAALLTLTDLKTEGTADYRDPGWDRHLYVLMARTNPLDFHVAPFCWRVLVPALAWASPLPLQVTFLTVAVVVATAMAMVLYWLFRASGFARTLSLTGVLLFFSLGWATRYQLADFWLPDATAFLAVALALLLAAKRRPALFAATLLAGVLAKESVIFAAPLYYTLNTGRLADLRLALKTVGLALPALAALLLLRLTIPAWNNDAAYIATLPPNISRFPELVQNYSVVARLRDVGLDQRYHARNLDTLHLYTTATFGVPLLALAAFGIRAQGRLALRLAPFVALAYAQILFATDTERLLVLAAPAVTWLALAGAADLCARTPLRPGHFLALAIGAFALLLVDRRRYETPLLQQLALLGVWGVAVVLLAVARQRRAGGAPVNHPQTGTDGRE